MLRFHVIFCQLLVSSFSLISCDNVYTDKLGVFGTVPDSLRNRNVSVSLEK
jgi:hypothetical protein